MAEKLPISRMQRDLTDSTVLRNMGVAFGYSLLAYESLARGLHKLEVNPARLAEDLDTNWDVLAEPIQTVMRKYNIADAYEQLKDLTRGKGGLTVEAMQSFVATLPISDADRMTLHRMTPASYTGLAQQLASEISHIANTNV